MTFILTEECNWRCSYCYQPRGKARISRSDLSRACDVFFPLLSDTCQVSFYGGEPLLALNLIRHIVSEMQRRNRSGKKRLRYLLTTNGSRLTPDVLDFLEENRFEILLSFDGRAQEEERCPGSSPKTSRLLNRLLASKIIRLGTNSVFTPRTARWLSETLRDLAERGVQEILYTLCVCSSWNRRARHAIEGELHKVSAWLLEFYKRNRRIPLIPFRQSGARRIFSCTGGRDRLAIAADGTLWGCYLFADYFRSRPAELEAQAYSFGRLDDFPGPSGSFFQGRQRNYTRLNMARMSTSSSPCLVCDDMEECSVCPAAAAFSSGSIGQISEDACWSSRLFIRQRQCFWEEAQNWTSGSALSAPFGLP